MKVLQVVCAQLNVFPSSPTAFGVGRKERTRPSTPGSPNLYVAPGEQIIAGDFGFCSLRPARRNYDDDVFQVEMTKGGAVQECRGIPNKFLVQKNSIVNIREEHTELQVGSNVVNFSA